MFYYLLYDCHPPGTVEKCASPLSVIQSGIRAPSVLTGLTTTCSRYQKQLVLERRGTTSRYKALAVSSDFLSPIVNTLLSSRRNFKNYCTKKTSKLLTKNDSKLDSQQCWLHKMTEVLPLNKFDCSLLSSQHLPVGSPEMHSSSLT